MNFRPEQYKLMMTDVRKWWEIHNMGKYTLKKCAEVLDLLENLVYTQGREQPT